MIAKEFNKWAHGKKRNLPSRRTVQVCAFLTVIASSIAMGIPFADHVRSVNIERDRIANENEARYLANQEIASAAIRREHASYDKAVSAYESRMSDIAISACASRGLEGLTVSHDDDSMSGSVTCGKSSTHVVRAKIDLDGLPTKPDTFEYMSVYKQNHPDQAKLIGDATE